MDSEICRASFWRSPHETEFYFIWCDEHPPLPTTSFSSFAQFFQANQFHLNPLRKKVSTPTVSDMVSNPRSASKRKSAVYGLNGLRPTLRVGALHLKSSTAARSCSYGRFPWAALLCFAFGQKIWHTIFFSSKPNFKIFPKLARYGSSALSGVEHLRLLVGKDTYADALLRHFGSLKVLSRASFKELRQINAVPKPCSTGAIF